MATCPNCGKKLHFWNIKAECSNCGVSIPNFNWIERLEEDNKNAEQSFVKFNKTINRIKYSLFGTKLRIARLVLTFLPAIGFILPWATINSDSNSFQLTLLSFTGAKSAIDMLVQLFSKSSLLTANMGFEGNGGPVTFMLIGTILFFLSALLIVIAFFLNIIMCKKPKTKSTVVFDILSIAASIASVVIFKIAGTLGAESIVFTYGEFNAINASGGISWGYFIALVLLLIAAGINIAVAVAPAKSDELLEEERLARVAAKEAKEREEELKKAKAREEADKAYQEEQKKIVEEAKRKVAEKKAKENKKAAKKQ